MDENQLAKLMGWLLLAWIAYYLLGFALPFLTYATVGLVILCVLQHYHRTRK